MPISGLVITLSNDPALAEQALAFLNGDRRIELGERRGPCQPIVVDTTDLHEDHRLRAQVCEQDGILKVDVTFVGFDEENGRRATGSEGPVKARLAQSEWAKQPRSNSAEIRT